MNIEAIFYDVMNSNNKLVLLIDAILFLFFVVAVFYLLIFALASLFNADEKYPKANKKHSFVIIYTVFTDNNIIIETIKNFLKQDYPNDKYKIVTLINDKLGYQITELNKLGVYTIPMHGSSFTKAYGFKTASEYIKTNNIACDLVVLLDEDNDVDDDMLSKINNAYYSGCDAIQTHRIAKKMDTRIAVLDAISEEINNSIFRKGHTGLGFSSALIGSGMAFDFELFGKCVESCSVFGFDKQFEKILLSNNIYIEYLESVFTYDEKVNNKQVFLEQRTRWFSSQFYNLFNGILGFPIAFIKGQWDYCDKLLQWMLPPRVLLFGFLIIISSFLTIFDWVLSIKWWGLFLLLCLTFIIAIPNYLVDHKLKDAIKGLPLVFLMMIKGIFRARRKENAIQRLRE